MCYARGMNVEKEYTPDEYKRFIENQLGPNWHGHMFASIIEKTMRWRRPAMVSDDEHPVGYWMDLETGRRQMDEENF